MNNANIRLTVALLAAFAAAPCAHAQKRPAKEDAPITRTPDSQRAKPELYPRLDPGSVFCDTAENLDRHSEVVNARLDGRPAPVEPAGCALLRGTVGISILKRASPGHTQVKLTRAPGSVGWTDAFLPDRDPVAPRTTNAAAPGF